MIRVKIVKSHPKYHVNEIVELSRNEAFGLLDSGYAIISKDMTAQDYKVTKAKKRSNGNR